MISTDREYRCFSLEHRESDGEMIVDGYAITFESPTVLYSSDGIDYSEIIDRHALDHTNLTDVVMNFNHSGKPVARTKNGTLALSIDEIGLKIHAVLSGTADGRALFEEIRGGYIDKMSFAFVVDDDGDDYDKTTHTRRVKSIKRLYDVAAVDFPAYETTSISARNRFAAEAAKAKSEDLAIRRRRIKIKSFI